MDRHLIGTPLIKNKNKNKNNVEDKVDEDNIAKMKKRNAECGTMCANLCMQIIYVCMYTDELIVYFSIVFNYLIDN